MRHHSKEILAIIPARGGSKGLPRKNIIPLGGKPLIAHTIEAALESRLITRVVVSTEDREIAEVAEIHGAEIPFLRPMELAGDRSNLGSALAYTRQRLEAEGYRPWAVVHLYATSPFRPPGFIDFLLSKLYEGHQTVQTVRRVDIDRAPLYHQDLETGRLRAFRFLARDNGQCFRPYGNVFGSRTGLAPKGTYIHFLSDPAMCIDIDTAEDLREAENVLNVRACRVQSA